MLWRCWFTGMFSSRISSTTGLSWLSSPAMEFGWIYKKEEGNRYRIYKGREVRRSRTVASADVFEVRALSWYLKPRSEEVDASGRAKGNHD